MIDRLTLYMNRVRQAASEVRRETVRGYDVEDHG